MKSNTKIAVAKKYQGMIAEIDFEGKDSGYWAYSKKGYRFADMGCHTAHEHSKKELLSVIRSLEECDCEHCEEDEQDHIEFDEDIHDVPFIETTWASLA